MRGYAQDLEVLNVPRELTGAAFDYVWQTYTDLWEQKEGAVAEELDSNYWRGAAFLHLDLEPDELVSLLLDGYDVTQEAKP